MQLVQSSYLLNDSKTVHGFDFSPLDRHRLRNEVIVGRAEALGGFHKNLSERLPVVELAFQQVGGRVGGVLMWVGVVVVGV